MSNKNSINNLIKSSSKNNEQNKRIITSDSLKKKRSYLIRKMNSSDDFLNDINKEVKNYFNFPENYFKTNTQISIGKKIELKEMNMTKNEYYLRKGINTQNNNKSKNTTISESFINLLSKTKNSKKQQNNTNDNFEIIDNFKLKDIFDSFKNQKEIKNEGSKIKNYDLISFNSEFSKKKNEDLLPRNLSLCLKQQNKRLTTLQKYDKKNKILSKYFSKILHKKEKDLLFNQIDSFLYKKEFINHIENSKSSDEKYKDFKWYINLRKPEDFKGERRTYINIRNSRNPFWGLVVEKNPIVEELAVKPEFDLNKVNFGKFNKKKLRKKELFKSLGNLEKISLKGKNLYQLEYKREMENKNRKILHKGFFENGKVILNHNINKMFGNKTIYKSYDEQDENVIEPQYINTERKELDEKNNRFIREVIGDSLEG